MAVVATAAAARTAAAAAAGAGAAPGAGPARALEAGRAAPPACSRELVAEFAAVRASFSQEVGGGGLPEAALDLSGCRNFARADLAGSVLSGADMSGASFRGANLRGAEVSRATARGADFAGADFTNANLFGSRWDGADLADARFPNAILTGAKFGRDPASGRWAELEGADFEGALLSQSDLRKLCKNPSLDDTARLEVLGCF